MKSEDIKKLLIGGIIALIVGILNQSTLNNSKICLIISLILISSIIFRWPDSDITNRQAYINKINIILFIFSILFFAGYFYYQTQDGNETQPPIGNETQPPIGNETQPPIGNETQPPIGNETQPPNGEEVICISTRPNEYSQLLSEIHSVCPGGDPNEDGVVPLEDNNNSINILSGMNPANQANPVVGMALEYGNGRVIALGTSGFFVDDAIDNLDNKKLAINIFKWLSGNEDGNIYVSNTYDPSNREFDKLKDYLIEEEFTVLFIDNDFSERIGSMRSDDILVIFDPNEKYKKNDIDQIEMFVYNGGRLLLMGVGKYINIDSQPEDIPINQIAKSYCIEFETKAITDKVYNCNYMRFPQFKNMF
jgi:hypothetical protein